MSITNEKANPEKHNNGKWYDQGVRHDGYALGRGLLGNPRKPGRVGAQSGLGPGLGWGPWAHMGPKDTICVKKY